MIEKKVICDKNGVVDGSFRILYDERKLSYLVDKGKDYVVKRWLSVFIAAKDLGKMIGQISMLPILSRVDLELVKKVTEAMEAKFGSFMNEKLGSFYLRINIPGILLKIEARRMNQLIS
jgi:hypothetical protein